MYNRRETFTSDGTLLSVIDVARDCADGPHEMRACMRDDLVRTMAGALPEGTIRFNSSVASIAPRLDGAHIPVPSMMIILSVLLITAVKYSHHVLVWVFLCSHRGPLRVR